MMVQVKLLQGHIWLNNLSRLFFFFPPRLPIRGDSNGRVCSKHISIDSRLPHTSFLKINYARKTLQGNKVDTFNRDTSTNSLMIYINSAFMFKMKTFTDNVHKGLKSQRWEKVWFHIKRKGVVNKEEFKLPPSIPHDNFSIIHGAIVAPSMSNWHLKSKVESYPPCQPVCTLSEVTYCWTFPNWYRLTALSLGTYRHWHSKAD